MTEQLDADVEASLQQYRSLSQVKRTAARTWQKSPSHVTFSA
jgi:hypothetical protein